MSDPKENLADRLVEEMRKPRDPAAEAERDAFEEQKAQALQAWLDAKKRQPTPAAPPRARPPSVEMPTGAAYERVLAAPSSLAAREALAAEWRANHDPRAELIDKQLRLRTHQLAGTRWSDEAKALAREIYVLVREHGATWAGPLAKHVHDYAFHRGCVAEVTIAGAAFTKEMPPLCRHAPIQHVNLVAPLALDEVAASPYLARLASLRICELRGGFGDAEAIMLANSPHVANLKWLSLTDNAIGKPGVEAIAASPHLARCLFVDFRGNPCDPTPNVSSYEGIETRSRSMYAEELERTYGLRPWLAVPADDVDWPPHRDELAITE